MLIFCSLASFLHFICSVLQPLNVLHFTCVFLLLLLFYGCSSSPSLTTFEPSEQTCFRHECTLNELSCRGDSATGSGARLPRVFTNPQTPAAFADSPLHATDTPPLQLLHADKHIHTHDHVPCNTFFFFWFF